VTKHHVPEGLNLHFLFTLHVDPVQEPFKAPKLKHYLDEAHTHMWKNTFISLTTSKTLQAANICYLWSHIIQQPFYWAINLYESIIWYWHGWLAVKLTLCRSNLKPYCMGRKAAFFQQAFKFTYYSRNRSPLQEKKNHNNYTKKDRMITLFLSYS